MPPSVNTGHTTHPALHLRDAADAHVVFEAVRLKILPLIKRRLTAEERDHLSSGNVFVWEEAEHKGGLERWTDGRRWSQSRMKGEYLFYEEKVETTEEEKQAKAARRANRNSSPMLQTYTPTRRQDRPAKPDGLTKQTYSTHVYLPGSASPRKWHIVAYFSGNDYQRLPVIENYDYLRNLHIPEGIFFSSKGIVRMADRLLLSGDEDDDYQSGGSSMHDGISYGPSSPVQQYSIGSEHREHRGRSSSFYGAYPSESRYTAPGPSTMQPHSPQSPSTSRPSTFRALSHESGSLPRLHTIAPILPTSQNASYSISPTSSNTPGLHASGLGRPQSQHPPQSQSYLPLSSEDRRALNTFKVVL